MPWLVFDDPTKYEEESVPQVFALYFRGEEARRAWVLEAGGGVREAPQLIPTYQGAVSAIDRLAELADGNLARQGRLMKTLEYEGALYARAEGKVYRYDHTDPNPQFNEIATLPPSLVKLRGGGIGILDDE